MQFRSWEERQEAQRAVARHRQREAAREGYSIVHGPAGEE